MNPFLKKIISNPDTILLLNSIYDGVYIVDINRKILFWNKGAEKITGHLYADIVRHKCYDNMLNHIDENGNLLCNGNCPIMESMIKDKNIERKIYPLGKDKKRFPVITRVGPIKDRNGKIVGAIEVFRDITKEQELGILQEKFNEHIKKFVSSTTYQEVIKQTNSDKPVTTQMRDLSILYADVVGFSSFTERNGAHEAATMLNELFSICVEEINNNNGDIDKFIGDAVMATFIDANDAVLSAEKILKKLADENKERADAGKERIQLHIGINSGNVIQAEIGAIDRKDYTILGDAVNIAARIQEMSDPDTIFISESTYSRLKNSSNYSFFKKLAVKGRTEPIAVYKSV